MKSSISRVYGVHNMFSAYHGTDSQAAPRVLYPRHKFTHLVLEFRGRTEKLVIMDKSQVQCDTTIHT